LLVLHGRPFKVFGGGDGDDGVELLNAELRALAVAGIGIPDGEGVEILVLPMYRKSIT
jgi:hypothetical protein